MSAENKSGNFDHGGGGQHELMTEAEVIAYLGFDREPGDPRERLRNYIRRQRLPVLKRGRLVRFRRAEVDAWLEAGRIPTPTRLRKNTGKTSANGVVRH